MPVPSLEKACPDCWGNLHYEDTFPHPERRGYEIHAYRCLECGPIVHVTEGAEKKWVGRWDKYPVAGGEACSE